MCFKWTQFYTFSKKYKFMRTNLGSRRNISWRSKFLFTIIYHGKSIYLYVCAINSFWSRRWNNGYKIVIKVFLVLPKSLYSKVFYKKRAKKELCSKLHSKGYCVVFSLFGIRRRKWPRKNKIKKMASTSGVQISSL